MPTYQVVLFSAAITVVFTQGTIFKFLRRGPWLWRELASCALCTGVWVGMGMSLLFSGFPHVGGDLLTDLSSLVRLLGVGSVSGCAALLFVAVWEKLDTRGALLSIENATMTVPNAQIHAPRVKFTGEAFQPEEAPTDPVSSDSRLTKKVPTDRLRIEASRRSHPEKDGDK